MEAFSEYLKTLDSLLPTLNRKIDSSDLANSIDAALDGQPARELRRLVPINDLRASGAFFTGSKLSKLALEYLLPSIDNNSIILDPACGAGDLLIACTSQLPRLKSVDSTLTSWNSRLIGRDLHSEFIKATKTRLMLSAFRSAANQSEYAPAIKDEFFPDITVGCGLSDDSLFKKATHIVTNPPFTMVNAPQDCSWAKGIVNLAAVFMEKIVTCANLNTRIVAILPDVLRSGSRYEKWRKLIEKRTKIHRVKLFGKFDSSADVDVFILELITATNLTHNTNEWQVPCSTSSDRLNNRFEICVGPVVDYRDPHEGQWHPFIKAKNLPPWEEIMHIDEHRRFPGRVIHSPFVAVRRTSRPGDRHRAIGTLIISKIPVAVENHLIVLRPIDGTERSCRELLDNLKNIKTTEWLNQRIRCRHLTISALADLPWWGGNGE